MGLADGDELRDPIAFYGTFGLIPAPIGQTHVQVGVDATFAASRRLSFEIGMGVWRHRPNACAKVAVAFGCTPAATPLSTLDARVNYGLVNGPIPVVGRRWLARVDAIVGAGRIASSDEMGPQRCAVPPAQLCRRGGRRTHATAVLGTSLQVAPSDAARFRLALEHRRYLDTAYESAPDANRVWTATIGFGLAMGSRREDRDLRKPIQDL